MGEKVDEEIAKLLLKMLNPLTLEVALKVQNELNTRKLETDKFYKQQVERVRYGMELARKRYMLVDPQNRLVATELEAEWNLKLRELTKAQKDYEKKKDCDLKKEADFSKSDIMQIVSDFTDLWDNENVSFKDKKRMLRLLIEDVILKNDDKKVIANIRFRGGRSKTLLIDRKLPMFKARKISDKIISEVDELTEDYAPSEVAAILNKKGCRLWSGNMFAYRSVFSK